MLSARTRTALTGLCLALCCAPAVARAEGLSDDAELARVVTLYEAGKYAECAKEFAGLVDGATPRLKDPDVLERARIYYAACLIGAGRVEEAEEQMRAAIRQNPQMRAPDSLVFPGPVIDRFFKVRQTLIDEIKRAEAVDLERKRAEAAAAARRAAAEKRRVERLEELASREVVVTRNQRWIAALPFGVGQFQNRNPVLGWIFLGSEALLAGTALTAMVIELDLNARADDDPPPDPSDLNPKLQAAHRVLVYSTWGFLGVATAGVLEAQLAFVPEFRDTVRRPLAPELRRPPDAPTVSVRPAALAAPHGVQLVLLGRF